MVRPEHIWVRTPYISLILYVYLLWYILWDSHKICKQRGQWIPTFPKWKPQYVNHKISQPHQIPYVLHNWSILTPTDPFTTPSCFTKCDVFGKKITAFVKLCLALIRNFRSHFGWVTYGETHDQAYYSVLTGGQMTVVHGVRLTRGYVL